MEMLQTHNYQLSPDRQKEREELIIFVAQAADGGWLGHPVPRMLGEAVLQH